MIKRLRYKFIAASMFSLAVVLFFILGSVNFVSYQKVIRDAGCCFDRAGREWRNVSKAPWGAAACGMEADRGNQ